MVTDSMGMKARKLFVEQCPSFRFEKRAREFLSKARLSKQIVEPQRKRSLAGNEKRGEFASVFGEKPEASRSMGGQVEAP